MLYNKYVPRNPPRLWLWVFASVVISTVLFYLLSIVNNHHNNLYRKYLQGAWHCLSEPKVVRVFYANNSYQEFGRAEPYSRHKLWRKDYLAVGQFNMQQSVLSIDKRISFPSSGLNKHKNIAHRKLRSYKLLEITKDLLFLKRVNVKRADYSVGKQRWLLCKKQSTIKFNKFMDYITRKRENKKKLRRISLQQAGKVQQLVNKKNKMIYRLNQSLCPDKNVNILWLISQLEQAIRKVSDKISVQLLRQRGDYFNLKISVKAENIQSELMRYLRQTGWLTINRISSHQSGGKFVFSIFMKRKPDNTPCLSLVSLPKSAKWLSYHQRQLAQLHRLNKKRTPAVWQRKKYELVAYLFKSLQDIQKKFEHDSNQESDIKFKWRAVRPTSGKYQLSYVATYARIKKILVMLHSSQFSGNITNVEVSPAQVLTPQHASLVQLTLMVRPFTNKQVDRQYNKFRLKTSLKTPLLSIILPKKYSRLSPEINLFY